MKVVNLCPNIPDNWKGTRAESARLLGINPKTLDKYIRIAEQDRLITVKRSWVSGRIQYTGELVKYIWYLI